MDLSIRKAFTAIALSATLCSGTALAAAPAASASTHPKISNATAICGTQCIDVSNLLLNQKNGPDYILNAVGGAHASALNFRQASNTRVNEDFEGNLTALLGQFCPNDLLGGSGLSGTSYVCLNYPASTPVFQAQFSPDAGQSGRCVGLKVADAAQRTSLVPCGATVRSLFVQDTAHGKLVGGRFYAPYIAASDTFSSNPLVLSFNPNSKKPANVQRVERENLVGTSVQDRQMINVEVGPAA